MSIDDMRDLLKGQKSEIEAIAKNAIARDKKGVVAGLVGLLTFAATGIPGLNTVVSKGVSIAFGEPANDILGKQIAAWEEEKKGHQIVSLVSSAIESLVYDALAASVRSQATSAEALEVVLHDSLVQITRGQNSWGERIVQHLGQPLSTVLDSGTRNLPSRASPATLLNAHFGVVPFVEDLRIGEIGRLRTWLDAAEGPLVGTIAGGGGTGKTRLAIELCRRLRDEGVWFAGFLRDGDEGDLIASLERDTRPTLIVLDYAEARPRIGTLLEDLAAVSQERPSPLRVLLLARNVTDWWIGLKGRDSIGHLLEEPLMLNQEGVDPATRRLMFDTAFRKFARLVKTSVTAVAPPDLSENEYQRPLFVQMAALSLALGDPSLSAIQLLVWLLRHEEVFWSRILELRPDSPEERIGLRQMRQFVATLTLVGGASDFAAAKGLADRCPGIRDGTLLVDAAHELYPGSYVRWLEPDILGEELVSQVLTDASTPNDWLMEVFKHASESQSRNALIVLGRAAGRRPADHERWRNRIENILRLDIQRLALPAVEAALAVGEKTAFAPLGAALAVVLEQGAPLQTAHIITPLIPQETVSLREVAFWATRTILESVDANQYEERAALLNNLGLRLRELGRREDAVAASSEAVDLYRRVAAASPDTAFPDLAMSLNNLGIVFSELGRREDALSATGEAVDVYRKVAAARGDALLLDLAVGLNNFGLALDRLGHLEEAFAATSEAVDIHRKLAVARPAAFLPGLAIVLSNLSANLSGLGRREDALAAIIEAVEAHRKLSEGKPDAFLPNLALNLSNLGNKLSELGRPEDALVSTREAVDIHRKLAEARPAAFLPNLSVSLNNLGNRLGELGRRDDALAATSEAVAIRRQLAATRPVVFLPDLASSLNNLGNRLNDLGRRDDALAATNEAVDLYCGLAAAKPGAFLPHLALSLNNLGIGLRDLGRLEEGLTATNEAVSIRRTLAATRPDAFLPDLASSLDTLCQMLRDLGRLEDALSAANEVVDLFLKLEIRFPDRFGRELAHARGTLERMRSA